MIYIYIYIYVGRGDVMIRLETLIELRFLHSSLSRSNLSNRVVRACPLIEARQTVAEQFEASRAIRGSTISVIGTVPPLLDHSCHILLFQPIL